MNQTNCPICNYPEGKVGYHFRGIYSRGSLCKGCGYIEKTPVTVSEVTISQKCVVALEPGLDVLVFLDWSIPTNPKLKTCHKRSEDGILHKFEPSDVQEKAIMYYVKEMWMRWLKLT